LEYGERDHHRGNDCDTDDPERHPLEPLVNSLFVLLLISGSEPLTNEALFLFVAKP